MAQTLLTVCGEVAPDTAARIASGQRPRADYFELARAFDADIIDYAEARRSGGAAGRLLERLGGPALSLAWACFLRRDRYQAIISDSEQVGIPLALLLRLAASGRPRHLMIAHILSVGKKLPFFDLLGAHHAIDTFFVYSTWQQRFITQRWSLSPERVVFTPFMVDARFFSPDAVTPNRDGRPMICTAGLERRDYPSLMRAVDGLDVNVVAAAASPWSRQSDGTQAIPIPPNVEVRRFSQFDLRQLYANSRFVVMPLQEVTFQAGVTAILEAMAMGRAVICTRTPGQSDVVVEGETGLYVPPGDPVALRAAIEHLLTHPEEAERMGQAGRRLVEQMMSLDCYAERLGEHVRSSLSATYALNHGT